MHCAADHCKGSCTTRSSDRGVMYNTTCNPINVSVMHVRASSHACHTCGVISGCSGTTELAPCMWRASRLAPPAVVPPPVVDPLPQPVLAMSDTSRSPVVNRPSTWRSSGVKTSLAHAGRNDSCTSTQGAARNEHARGCPTDVMTAPYWPQSVHAGTGPDVPMDSAVLMKKLPTAGRAGLGAVDWRTTPPGRHSDTVYAAASSDSSDSGGWDV